MAGMSEKARYGLRILIIDALVTLALIAFAYDIARSHGKSGEAISTAISRWLAKVVIAFADIKFRN
jgi:hypothetical protein